MFIRTKKIKNNDYAYLVENQWVKGRIKQKVKKYLGRVHEVKRTGNDSTVNKNYSKDDLLKKIMITELLNHGFEEKKNLLKKENIIINTKNLSVKNNKKNIVLRMNEGFMCKETIKKLFKIKKEEENTPGLKLANSFAEAGIKPDKEIFVEAYKKIYK
jgi:hypothetical protein